MLPLTVKNPMTDEYILAGNWNMDVNQRRVTNFTADMQVELTTDQTLTPTNF
jgi:hypothetical protein